MSARHSTPLRRIAYLVGQYPATVATYVLREITHLRRCGVDVEPFSVRDADRPAAGMLATERDEHERTYYVKRALLGRGLLEHAAMIATRPHRYFAGLAYAIRYGRADLRQMAFGIMSWAEAVVLGRVMMRRGLSHVHVHFAPTVSLMLTRMFPITMSITFHGPEEFDDPVGTRLGEKIKAASFACAISNFARSQMMRAVSPEHWSKVEVTPLGVDPDQFVPVERPDRPEPFEILCVGRLAPAKGQHILIDAIARLVQAGRNVRLRLVGDGVDRVALERHAAARGVADAVVFEGWQNQDRVRALYRQADTFALASFAEGVPVVLMEAMAMEIPCVATRITGIPELVRDEIDGLLVPASDVTAFASALARLMDDAGLRRALGKSARRQVTSRYDLTRNYDRLFDVFSRRIGDAARGRDGETSAAPVAAGPSGEREARPAQGAPSFARSTISG